MLGIGLNVTTTEFPVELSGIATSLRLAGVEYEVEALLPELLAALERRLDAPVAELLAAWSERDALRGERVRWDAGEGTAVGIDESGALLVDTPEGRVALDAGEVHLLREREGAG